MFVIRFDFTEGPLYAARIGRGTTAGSWGFGPYDEAETFDTAVEAEELLGEQYSSGTAHRLASVVDGFDELPASDPRPG